MNDQDLNLLSEGQIWGHDNESQLEVMRKYGTKAAITDLCILTGSYAYRMSPNYYIAEGSILKGRTCWFWTRSSNNDDVRMVGLDGERGQFYRYLRYGAIRPVLKSSIIFPLIFPNRVKGYNETEEVEYGEYPQYAVEEKMQSTLELEYNKGMNKTGGSYTFDSVKIDDHDTEFKPVTYEEYEHQKKKYIRVKANSAFYEKPFLLSNGIEYKDEDYVWVEVSPVKWLIDEKTGLLISKFGLVSGIRFLDRKTSYTGNFSKTKMKEYLDKYMLRDLTQSIELAHMMSEEKSEYKRVLKK